MPDQQIINDIQRDAKISPINRFSYILETKGGMCDDIDLNSDLAIIYAGYEKMAPGYHIKMVNYPFYRLSYTLDGGMTIQDEFGTQPVKAGMVYGYSPRESTAIEVDANHYWSYFYIHFTGRKAADLMKRSTLPNKHAVSVANSNETQKLFETIVAESMTRSPNTQSICAGYLQVLLLKLSDFIIQSGEQLSSSLITYNECRNYIYENFERLSSIQEVAEGCCISKAYLCRLFKQHAGITPLQQIVRLKLNKAASLLLTTNMSVKQVGMKLNFENQFYFSNCFKKAHGMSPNRYRQAHT